MRDRRNLALLIACALCVVASIVAVFLASQRRGEREDIVLPPLQDASVLPPTEAVESLSPFLSVSPENVAAVIESMSRPQAYTLQLLVTTYYGEQSHSKQVQIWRNGAHVKAEITEHDQLRHILTDGASVYIWYEGDESAAQMTANADISMDELIGIPSYETVAALTPDSIAAAEFQPRGQETESYFYVRTREEDGASNLYWIDAQTQLLSLAEGRANGQIVYTLAQEDLQILSAQDEILLEKFTWPT